MGFSQLMGIPDNTTGLKKVTFTAGLFLLGKSSYTLVSKSIQIQNNNEHYTASIVEGKKEIFFPLKFISIENFPIYLEMV